MKREYKTPMFVLEQFTPDESIALGCNRNPGGDPDPQTIICYYHANKTYVGCSNKQYSKTVFMDGNNNCDFRAKTDGSIITANGITSCTEDFVDGCYRYKTHPDHEEDAYKWSNGNRNGYHYVKKGEISTMDDVGTIVTYFNS